LDFGAEVGDPALLADEKFREWIAPAKFTGIEEDSFSMMANH
jgi:hypothetical protein